MIQKISIGNVRDVIDLLSMQVIDKEEAREILGLDENDGNVPNGIPKEDES